MMMLIVFLYLEITKSTERKRIYYSRVSVKCLDLVQVLRFGQNLVIT